MIEGTSININSLIGGDEKAFQVFFVDYYPLFLNKDEHSMCKELSLEGLHPNVFGYDKMTETLKNTINFNEYFSDNARKNTFGR